MVAAYNGHVSVVEMLLERGADIHAAAHVSQSVSQSANRTHTHTHTPTTHIHTRVRESEVIMEGK
jgi:ankyrin repeat protein